MEQSAPLNYTIDFTDLMILELIHQHKLAKDIAQTLSFSKGAISYRLKHLIASGLIQVSKVGLIKEIQLTPKGSSLNEQFKHANTPTSLNYSKTHQIRIEALIFKIPLKSRIIPSEYRPKFPQSTVTNSRGYSELVFTDENANLRLTTKSLIIHLKEQYIQLSDDILQVYTGIKAKMTQICNEYEQKGINLQRYDKMSYKITPIKTEIAFEHNEIANKSKDEHKIVKLFDKKDGKLRAEVDMSKGFPEFEFKHHKKSWSDASYFNDSMWQLFDGRFQQFQNNTMKNQEMFMQDIKQILNLQLNYGENINKHVEVLTKMEKALDDFTLVLNQFHSPAKPESLVNPQNLKLQSDLNVKSSVFGRQKEESVEPFGNGSTVEAQQTDTGRTLDNKKDEAKKSIKYNKNNNLI